MTALKRKKKILIADDSELNREILAEILGEEYDIVEAENGAMAMAELQRDNAEIAMILLDYVMPEMDGFEVLRAMNRKHWIEEIPVIMISAESSRTYMEQAYELGVTDFITRPFEPLVIQRRVKNTMMLYAKQRRLTDMVIEQIYEKERQSDLMIDMLSHIVEFRNGESGSHVQNIHVLTELMLKHLVTTTDKYPLTAADIAMISTASALHDIGKICIPEEVLNKPGRLTVEEFEIMKTHAEVGAKMIRDMPAFEDEPMMKLAYEICRWHHERYDGRGYPDGLKGDDIPIGAQIVALADVYDALTSERVYKRAFSHEVAVEMILDGQCGTFNPVLMQCLRELAPVLQEELDRAVVMNSNERRLEEITQDVMRRNDLPISSHPMGLLERERVKYGFFAALARDIWFEFTQTPPLLTFSPRGAKRLGVDEVIVNPLKNEQTLSIVGEEDVRAFIEKVRATTAEQPVLEYNCSMRIDGRVRDMNVIARSMWTWDDPPKYTGIIGKIVDAQEQQNGSTWNINKWMNTHDLLTGLYTPTMAAGYIRKWLESPLDRNAALVLIRLENYRVLSEGYGNSYADRVIYYMAERLHRLAHGGDILARLEGETFMAFLETRDDVRSEVQRIFNGMEGSYEDITLSVRVGAACVNEGEMPTYETLLSTAIQALESTTRAEDGRMVCFHWNDESTDWGGESHESEDLL